MGRMDGGSGLTGRAKEKARNLRAGGGTSRREGGGGGGGGEREREKREERGGERERERRMEEGEEEAGGSRGQTKIEGRGESWHRRASDDEATKRRRDEAARTPEPEAARVGARVGAQSVLCQAAQHNYDR